MKDNPKYPEDNVTSLNKKYYALLNNYTDKITLDSLFHIGAKYGWNLPEELKKKKEHYFDLTKEHLSFYYDFEFNLLTQKLLWKNKKDTFYADFNDSDLAT